jgi:hypothetical protein
MNDINAYATRILRIAEDLSQLRYLAELDHSIEQLRGIARELQRETLPGSGIQSHGTD